MINYYIENYNETMQVIIVLKLTDSEGVHVCFK